MSGKIIARVKAREKAASVKRIAAAAEELSEMLDRREAERLLQEWRQRRAMPWYTRLVMALKS